MTYNAVVKTISGSIVSQCTSILCYVAAVAVVAVVVVLLVDPIRHGSGSNISLPWASFPSRQTHNSISPQELPFTRSYPSRVFH